jgi:hypothetical protein
VSIISKTRKIQFREEEEENANTFVEISTYNRMEEKYKKGATTARLGAKKEELILHKKEHEHNKQRLQ